MDDIIKLVTAAAWPLVTLVALVMLGPGGYLMRFADRFGKALSDFTVAMPQLEKTALQMRSAVDSFTAQSKEMSETMLKTSAEVETRVSQLSAATNSISEQLSYLNEKTLLISDTVSQIDREKMVETQEHLANTIDQLDGEYDQPEAEPTRPALSTEEMISSLKEQWNRLTEVLRTRSGNRIAFDKRQIGSVAWSLADGRRSNPISHETAELVQELHSQYKRFVRLINSRDEWLTPAIYLTFVSGVNKAIAELEDDY